MRLQWMHNDGIGAQGTGGDHIKDYSTPEDSKAGYGPFKTRQLALNDPTQCITNADSFLWLAYEILWTKNCLSGNDRFKDPAADNTVASALPALPPNPTLTGQLTDDGIPVTATIPAFISASPSTPTPSCEHAADPDGAMGLCPNLADDGWCDCGSAGDFPVLGGSDFCGYTALPTQTLALTTTNCQSSSPTTSLVTLTVVPIPATTA